MKAASIEPNTRASRNGKKIEKLVMRLLPGVVFGDGKFDAKYKGKHLEIKSCVESAIDRSHPNTQCRSGRFFFKEAQHEALTEAGGEYLFCVHSEEDPADPIDPVIFVRVPAEKIQLSAFSDGKSVAWTKVFRMVI
ncbi:TPA: hypothetical protein HA338_06220 [Methanosarcina acetivorans]|uniref:Uncharacterized protein n=2 Tax=Methanosarcina acetivorans TaxID=2214 RepID=Q8TJF3_METAC|nr:hypothetical protein [Methanosarcina acetivorans]AAM07183.1 predicted protein [Methanosarcina acetivorans C2A]HIH93636.1 hypothetical protein [Methanosarcina acetivorans]